MRKPALAFAASLAAMLLLAGCVEVAAEQPSPAPAAQGSWLPAGAVVHRDIAYGTDPLQRLDVYAPADAHDAPILLMVHGGGWVRGDKAASGVVDNKVAHYLPSGFLVVSTNYRLSPEVDPAGEAGDVASALAFVQGHAAEWGGSSRKVVLMGHSAGANLVGLLAADPSIAAGAGASPWLGTVVLDSAAYDVVSIMQKPHLALYDPVFGQDEALWRESSPTLRLSAVPAPMLLVCDSDRADACPQAKGFASAVAAIAGDSPAGVVVYPVALRHGEISSELGTPTELTTRVDEFLAALGLNNAGGASG